MDLKETLAMISGKLVREHATRDCGRKRVTPALSVLVLEQDARDVVRKVREPLPRGFVCFVGTTRWLGKEKHEGHAEVVLAPGDTQFEALAIARIEQGGRRSRSEKLLATLQRWDASYGVDLWHAETGIIEFDLGRAPEDPRAMAAELAELFPASVAGDPGSLEALAADIERRSVRLRCS